MTTIECRTYQLFIIKENGNEFPITPKTRVQYIGAYYENVSKDSPNQYGYTLTQIPFIGEVSHIRTQPVKIAYSEMYETSVPETITTGVYIQPLCVFKDGEWHRIVNFDAFIHAELYPHLLVMSCCKRRDNHPRAMYNVDTIIESTIDISSITHTIELPIIFGV